MTQPTSQDTIPTRFLLLSDTHNRTPASPSSPSPSSPFRLPLPSSDVLLHAGDLTMSGGASNYREIIKWLATSDAELKLVIAGNHDIDLDADYYRATGMWAGTKEKMEKVEKEIREAREVWTGAEAAEAGVVYLEEGVREFYLSNGAWFTVCESIHSSFFFLCPGASVLRLIPSLYPLPFSHYHTSLIESIFPTFLMSAPPTNYKINKIDLHIPLPTRVLRLGLCLSPPYRPLQSPVPTRCQSHLLPIPPTPQPNPFAPRNRHHPHARSATRYPGSHLPRGKCRV